MVLVPFGGVMGGAALLEEMLHWGQVLRVHSLAPLPDHTLCFLLTGEGVNSQPPALATGRHGHVWHAVMDSPSGTVRQTKHYLPSVALAVVFYPGNREVAHRYGIFSLYIDFQFPQCCFCSSCSSPCLHYYSLITTFGIKAC